MKLLQVKHSVPVACNDFLVSIENCFVEVVPVSVSLFSACCLTGIIYEAEAFYTSFKRP
jgi:hypothetical protein